MHTFLKKKKTEKYPIDLFFFPLCRRHRRVCHSAPASQLAQVCVTTQLNSFNNCEQRTFFSYVAESSTSLGIVVLELSSTNTLQSELNVEVPATEKILGPNLIPLHDNAHQRQLGDVVVLVMTTVRQVNGEYHQTAVHLPWHSHDRRTWQTCLGHEMWLSYLHPLHLSLPPVVILLKSKTHTDSVVKARKERQRHLCNRLTLSFLAISSSIYGLPMMILPFFCSMAFSCSSSFYDV